MHAPFILTVLCALLCTALCQYETLLPSWAGASNPGGVCSCVTTGIGWFTPTGNSISRMKCFAYGNATFFDYSSGRLCPCIGSNEAWLCRAAQETGAVYSTTGQFAVDTDTICAEAVYFNRGYQERTGLVCYDQFGQTCGYKRGTYSTAAYYSGYLSPGGLVSDTPEPGYTRYCYVHRWRGACITPACPGQVVDCVLSDTYGPWSECRAVNGQCIQSRVKAILNNGTELGVQCPSLEQRTETVECLSSTECDRVLCNFTQITSVGNCSVTCGDGTKNVSVYNISSVPLPRCTANITRIVSSTAVPCGTTLPCSTINPAEAATVSCATVGSQGFRYSAPLYINVTLSGVTTLVSNFSNASLLTAFTIKNRQSGRVIDLTTSGHYISGTTLFLKLLVLDSNNQGSTGDLYSVTYAPKQGVPGALIADGFSLPGFICNTVDMSPPALTHALYDNLSSTRRLVYFFSEPVTLCSSPGSSLQNSFFTLIGTTNVVTTGTMTSVNSNRVWRRSVSNSASYASNAQVIPNATAFCDESGNANVYRPSEPIPMLLQPQNTYAVLPTGANLTWMFFVNKTISNVTNAAVITFPFVTQWSELLAQTDAIKAFVSYTSNGTTYYNNASRSAIYNEDVDTFGEEPSDVIRIIATFPTLMSSIYFPPDMPTSQEGIVFELRFESDLLPLALPTGWSGILIGDNQVNALPPPVLLYAITAFASNFVTAALSAPQTSAMTCDDINLAGYGCSLVNSTNSTITFIAEDLLYGTMRVNLSQSSLGLPVQYVPANNTGVATPYYVPLSFIDGPPPTINNTVVTSTTSDVTYNQLQLTFDSPLDSSVTPPTTAITVTSTDPYVESVTVQSVTVSGNTATVGINPVCVGTCENTHVGDLLVSVDDSFKGANGLSSKPITSAPVVDQTLPRINQAVEIDVGVVIVQFSEPLQSFSKLGLVPAPSKYTYFSNNTYVCVFAQTVTKDSIFQIGAAGVSDVAGNRPLTAQVTKFNYADSDNSCNIFKNDYFLGVFIGTILFAFASGVAIGLLVSKTRAIRRQYIA